MQVERIVRANRLMRTSRIVILVGFCLVAAAALGFARLASGGNGGRRAHLFHLADERPYDRGGPYGGDYKYAVLREKENGPFPERGPDEGYLIGARNIEPVNAALNELARTDPRITIIKTSELPHLRLHFGTKGTLLLGEAMADAYLKKERN